MKLLYIIITLTLLGGCTATYTSHEKVTHTKPDLTLSQKEKWEAMTGMWFGEQPTKDGNKMQWIVDRKENGVYIIIFRKYKNDGTYSQTTEIGQWAVSGPVYMTMFRGHLKDNKVKKVNPSNPYNYDAYEILELNEKYFKYKSYESGETYTLQKVNSDYSFPE